MQKITVLLIAAALIISCSPDKKTQLENLKAERDKLNEQISALETEMNQLDGVNPVAKKVPVNVMKVEPVRFQHFIELQGTVDSENNIGVPAEMGGVVRKVYVKKGDKVSKGQILAELDGTVIEKNLESLRTNLELAQTMYERQKRLWDQKIGSEMQYLQAKTQRDVLEKQISALEEQFRMTRIFAPISGTIDQVMVREGEAAAPGFPAFRVVQLSDLKVKGAISERFITSVKANDPVRVKFPLLEKEFNLRLSAVSQVIDPNNRTFGLEIKLPSSEEGIMPNMIAVMVINDYTAQEAIVVPQNTVQKTGSEDFVFVAEKDENDHWIARRRTVVPGRNYANQSEILSGLKPGDQIISFGFQNLADGQLISVVNE
jgi:membrane fusion protein, multidrug efflux system